MLKHITYKIHDWTFIEEDKEKHRSKQFIFECKCGKRLSKIICDLKKTGPKRCKSCATKIRNFGDFGRKKSKDLFGVKIGKWTVLHKDEKTSPTKWICKCECESTESVSGAALRSGKSMQCKTCACKKNATKHGYDIKGRVRPEYNSWSQMKNRCLNTKDKRFKNYGGRGISVYREWINSFESFIEYLGNKPDKNYSIDRINNDGNYEPGNVRWATPKQQANNRRIRTNNSMPAQEIT